MIAAVSRFDMFWLVVPRRGVLPFTGFEQLISCDVCPWTGPFSPLVDNTVEVVPTIQV